MRTQLSMVPDSMYRSVARSSLNTIKHMMYIKHRLLTLHRNADLPSAKITLDLQRNTNDRQPIMRLHILALELFLPRTIIKHGYHTLTETKRTYQREK